jgi:hypothetical protein
MATMLARTAWLRTRRRVEVVRRELTSRAMVAVTAAEALAPLL